MKFNVKSIYNLLELISSKTIENKIRFLCNFINLTFHTQIGFGKCRAFQAVLVLREASITVNEPNYLNSAIRKLNIVYNLALYKSSLYCSALVYLYFDSAN